MTFTRNVRRDFNTIGQTHAGDLAQRRIRLLGSHGTNNGANAAFLRRTLILAYTALLVTVQRELQRRGLALRLFILAALADHLIYCRHVRLRLQILSQRLFARNETIRYNIDGLICSCH